MLICPTFIIFRRQRKRLFTYEILTPSKRNGDTILSKCAEKWSESLLDEISEVSLSQSLKKIDKDSDYTYVSYLQFSYCIEPF